MSSIQLAYDPAALDDLRACPVDLRTLVLEHLSRIAADPASCSLPTAFPRMPGRREAGLWCRRPDGRAWLIEIIFSVNAEERVGIVRRVVISDHPRRPGWAVTPSEWTDARPWPVVDL